MSTGKYDNSISVSDFKDMLEKHGITMTPSSLNKLIAILDEDENGEITKKELHFALDLY